MLKRRHMARRRVLKLAGALGLVAMSVGLSACTNSNGTVAVSNQVAPTQPVSGSNAIIGTPSVVLPTPDPVPTLLPINPKGNVALVAGTPVAASLFLQTLARQRLLANSSAQQQPGSSLPTDAQIRKSTLDFLVELKVDAIYAAKHHVTVSESAIAQQIKTISGQYASTSAFHRAYTAMGYSPATFHELVRESIVRQRVIDRVAAIPILEVVRARHILFAPPAVPSPSVTAVATGVVAPAQATALAKVKTLADKVYAQLRVHPALFPSLAKQYSSDPGSKASGGNLGLFPRKLMVPAFERVAFSLKVGGISPPFKTQFGYHILQVLEHTRERVSLTTLSAADRTNFSQYLSAQQASYNTWLTAERKSDQVTVLLPAAAL